MGKYILIDNEKFFYKEAELFHGRKIINREVSKENLEVFHSIVEKTNVVYGLIFGTLLGAIREKNFIEHDEDIDLYVLNEHKQEFLKLLPLFKKSNLKLVRYEENILSLMRKNEYIDIYFFRAKRKFGFKKVRLFQNSYEINAKSLECTQRIDFLGMDIPIPSNAITILESLYGKSWKTPIKNYNAKSNSLHNKILRKFPNLINSPLAKLYKKIIYK